MRYQKWLAALSLALLAVFPCLALADMKVSFLNEGGAALIEADGQYMLVDAFQSSDADKLLSYVSSLGVSKIDLAAATRWDEENAGGLAAVSAQLEIASLWLPEGMTTGNPPANIQAKTPLTGDILDLGGAKITAWTIAGSNAPGLMLRVDYGARGFLFVPAVGEDSALPFNQSEAGAHADVVIAKAPVPQTLWDAATPLFVVSVGESGAAGTADSLTDSNTLTLQPGTDRIITFITDGTALKAEYEAVGVTVEGSVNLRKEPTTKAGRAATLTKGTVLNITGAQAAPEGLWFAVTADAKAGFVRGDLIREITAEEAEALLSQATPKPQKSTNENPAPNDDGTGEEAPPDCH